MFTLDLPWKSFNVNLSDVSDWISTNVTTNVSGLSANSVLQIHFTEDPSQEEIDEIKAYWNLLTEESPEAEGYKSSADLEVERLAKLASAKAKLEVLGLTQDEINAILGL